MPHWARSTVWMSDASQLTRSTHCTVMPLTDLPVPAIRLISQYARDRKIAGTNKYARVCRQWRDAVGDSEGAEPLQLYANLRHMSGDDIDSAFRYLAMHGQQVEVLVLQTCEGQDVPLDLFSRAAPSFSSLTWLHLEQRHSLVLLAPMLDQLSQLRHLRAAVDLGSGPAAEDTPAHEQAWEDSLGVGVFLDQSGNQWESGPDVEQLCPHLVQLNLSLNTVGTSDGQFWRRRHSIDKRLVQLLPAGLQQLTLAGGWKEMVRLVGRHVQHLTALQQLTLDGVVVYEGDARTMVESLGALQQLRLFSPATRRQEEVLQLLAPKVTAYWYSADEELDLLPQLTHLTMLMLSWRDASGGRMPEGTAEALAALTGLRALDLDGTMRAEAMEVVLQVVAGMEDLRSLQLGGCVDDPEALSSSLAQCTQLTALALLVRDDRAPYARPRRPPRYAPVPQQLTGLRSLQVPLGVLEHEGGGWLAALTQLTSLCCRVWPGDVRYAVVEGQLDQVQAWVPGVVKELVEEVQQAENAAALRRLSRMDGVSLYVDGLPISGGGSSTGASNVAVFIGGLSIQDDIALCDDPPPTPTYYRLTTVAGAAPVGHVMTEEKGWPGHGWSLPLQPCPHLPGVWELQGEAVGSSWSRSRELSPGWLRCAQVLVCGMAGRSTCLSPSVAAAHNVV